MSRPAVPVSIYDVKVGGGCPKQPLDLQGRRQSPPPPKPTGKTYSFLVRGERQATDTPAKGWSKASRRSEGYVADFMEDMTGETSPAKPGQRHFCGLRAATCDWR